MKFKNPNDQFEWEVLELSEDDYIKKIILLKPFENYKDSFFEYLNAREKWNEAVKGKRFIRKIKKSLEILNNKKYNYSEKLPNSVDSFKETENILNNPSEELKNLSEVLDNLNNKYISLLKCQMVGVSNW